MEFEKVREKISCEEIFQNLVNYANMILLSIEALFLDVSLQWKLTPVGKTLNLRGCYWFFPKILTFSYELSFKLIEKAIFGLFSGIMFLNWLILAKILEGLFWLDLEFLIALAWVFFKGERVFQLDFVILRFFSRNVPPKKPVVAPL